MVQIIGRMNSALRKKSGVALVMVVIALLVLSVLVVAFLSVSLVENKTEIYQNKKTQAYYIAWSGANSVGSWIMHNPASIDSLSGKTSSNLDSFSNGDVTIDISADPGNDTQYLVHAVGTVGGVDNNVTLRMQKLSSELLIDKAIYSNTDLDISGMEVSGDIQSGGNIAYSTNGNNAFTGTAYPNDYRHYQLAPFPNPPAYSPADLSVKHNDVTISGTGNSFNSITVENNASLILRPSGVMQIVVNDMTIDSSLIIDSLTTTDRVELYINNSLTVTTKGEINNDHPHKLIIFLKDGSNFYMQANKVLNGYVIGPLATMEIQSAQSTTNGALITNIIQKNAQGQGPNGAVNYYPPDSILDIDDILYSFKLLRWE